MARGQRNQGTGTPAPNSRPAQTPATQRTTRASRRGLATALEGVDDPERLVREAARRRRHQSQSQAGSPPNARRNATTAANNTAANNTAAPATAAATNDTNTTAVAAASNAGSIPTRNAQAMPTPAQPAPPQPSQVPQSPQGDIAARNAMPLQQPQSGPMTGRVMPAQQQKIGPTAANVVSDRKPQITSTAGNVVIPQPSQDGSVTGNIASPQHQQAAPTAANTMLPSQAQGVAAANSRLGLPPVNARHGLLPNTSANPIGNTTRHSQPSAGNGIRNGPDIARIQQDRGPFQRAPSGWTRTIQWYNTLPGRPPILLPATLPSPRDRNEVTRQTDERERAGNWRLASEVPQRVLRQDPQQPSQLSRGRVVTLSPEPMARVRACLLQNRPVNQQPATTVQNTRSIGAPLITGQGDPDDDDDDDDDDDSDDDGQGEDEDEEEEEDDEDDDHEDQNRILNQSLNLNRNQNRLDNTQRGSRNNNPFAQYDAEFEEYLRRVPDFDPQPDPGSDGARVQQPRIRSYWEVFCDVIQREMRRVFLHSRVKYYLLTNVHILYTILCSLGPLCFYWSIPGAVRLYIQNNPIGFMSWMFFTTVVWLAGDAAVRRTVNVRPPWNRRWGLMDYAAAVSSDWIMVFLLMVLRIPVRNDSVWDSVQAMAVPMVLYLAEWVGIAYREWQAQFWVVQQIWWMWYWENGVAHGLLLLLGLLNLWFFSGGERAAGEHGESGVEDLNRFTVTTRLHYMLTRTLLNNASASNNRA